MLTANDFMNIINDTHFYNLKKMKNKYGSTNIEEVIKILKSTFYKYIPICDFKNNDIAYSPSLININDDVYKILISGDNNKNYSIEKMENEIHSTLKIENINSDRNSIRNILEGATPKNNDENKIYGIKKGLDFISVKSNIISEENLYRLYMESIGFYLEEENKLLEGNHYRHDSVYVVGNKVSHCGLPHHLLKSYMSRFIDFINTKDEINTLEKSAVIHFYFAYIHPYFDGNGRMARLVQLWYLIQNGFNRSVRLFNTVVNSCVTEVKRIFNNGVSVLSCRAIGHIGSYIASVHILAFNVPFRRVFREIHIKHILQVSWNLESFNHKLLDYIRIKPSRTKSDINFTCFKRFRHSFFKSSDVHA